MNHTLITHYIIKEKIPSRRNRYEKGLGLSERAGRLRNKGRSCAIVNTVSYAF